MKSAALPADEPKRLHALQQLHLLDSPIQERFERITRMVCSTLGVSISAFTLLDAERQWFMSTQGFTVLETERAYSFCAHVILGDEVMTVPDATKDERFFDNPAVTGALGVNAYAGCPIRGPQGEKVGVLCAIDTKPREFSPSEMQMLRDLAGMVETELRAANLSDMQTRLLSELDAAQTLALVDPLTRVWNRRGIMRLLESRWAEAKRHNGVIVIVMADIDHFKQINDTHGHPVGDAVLQSVSRRLIAAMRDEDAIGRVGGEEFLLVLTGCEPSELKRTVERIRLLVAASDISVPGGDLKVTLSFGATAAQADENVTIEILIEFADRALYAAKRAGRNRVEITEEAA